MVTEGDQRWFSVAVIDDARLTPLPTQPPAFGTSLARANFRIQFKGIHIARSKYPSIDSGSGRNPAASGMKSGIVKTSNYTRYRVQFARQIGRASCRERAQR